MPGSAVSISRYDILRVGEGDEYEYFCEQHQATGNVGRCMVVGTAHWVTVPAHPPSTRGTKHWKPVPQPTQRAFPDPSPIVQRGTVRSQASKQRQMTETRKHGEPVQEP